MLGIYMAHDSTKIVKAHSKSKKLYIDDTAEISPYIEFLETEDINSLKELFEEVKIEFGNRTNEIHIILPDSVFISIDCIDYADNADFEAVIADKAGMEINQIYYTVPIVCRTNIINKKTVLSIKKSRIDTLIAAAKASSMTILSIEAASTAFFRLLNDWRKEQCLLEVFEDYATLVSYAPVAGMFKIDIPNFGLKKIGENPDEADAILATVLIQRDLVAKRTFDITNIAPPIIIDADKKLELPALKKRQSNITLEKTNHKYVVSNTGNNYDIVCGSLLQYIENDALYESMPNIINCENSNIIPESLRGENKFFLFKNKLVKGMKILSTILTGIIFIEICSLIYFSTIKIPDSLQADYDYAQSQMDSVKKEIALIKAAKLEHQYPLEIMQRLVTQLPDSLTFNKLEIGAHAALNKKAANAPDEEWISINAESIEPITFNDYAVRLENEDLFKKVTIKQISSASNGYKNAVISITKGKME